MSTPPNASIHPDQDNIHRLAPRDLRRHQDTILEVVNGASAEALQRRVPLLRYQGVDGVSLASKVVEARGAAGGKFTSLEQVADLLTAGRFTELAESLLVRDKAAPFDRTNSTPGGERFSASRSELDIDVEWLYGPAVGARQALTAARCTSCTTSLTPVLNKQAKRHEVRVDVTKAIFDGQSPMGNFNVWMDGEVAPYDYMQPTSAESDEFSFPAYMHLNNNMIIEVELPDGERMRLVSDKITSQIGKIHSWPPYGMRLHSVEPVDYHVENDPLKTPVLRVHDGTTFLTGPSNFLGHHTDITSVDWSVMNVADRTPSKVDIEWVPVPKDSKYEREADYYFVYRASGTGDEPLRWTNISGPVHDPRWSDENIPTDATELFYRVVSVWVTSLGLEFESFPGTTARVETNASPFRATMAHIRPDDPTVL